MCWSYKCIFPTVNVYVSFKSSSYGCLHLFSRNKYGILWPIPFFFFVFFLCGWGDAANQRACVKDEKMGGEKFQENFAGVFSCLIYCKAAAAAAAGEVAGHPASGDRRNFVLTLAAGNALKEGNASTEQLLGQSADYTRRTVKPVIHA